MRRCEWVAYDCEHSALTLLPRVCCMLCCPQHCDSDTSEMGTCAAASSGGRWCFQLYILNICQEFLWIWYLVVSLFGIQSLFPWELFWVWITSGGVGWL
jgi:hypothetical protein